MLVSSGVEYEIRKIERMYRRSDTIIGSAGGEGVSVVGLARGEVGYIGSGIDPPGESAHVVPVDTVPWRLAKLAKTQARGRNVIPRVPEQFPAHQTGLLPSCPRIPCCGRNRR